MTLKQYKKIKKAEGEQAKFEDKLAKQAIESESSLSLGGDTYAMAFKAFNWNVMKELQLRPDEVQASYMGVLFVFGIQVFMIMFVLSVINHLVPNVAFEIALPDSIYTLGARFVCTILMHL